MKEPLEQCELTMSLVEQNDYLPFSGRSVRGTERIALNNDLKRYICFLCNLKCVYMGKFYSITVPDAEIICR
jgi:hypothetical protein